MAYKFRGTTLTFGTPVGRLRSLTYTEGGNTIDITVSSSTGLCFEVGFSDYEVRATVIGGTTLTRASSPAALSVAYTDGTSVNLGTCIVTGVEISGDVDGTITSTITFKPTSA